MLGYYIIENEEASTIALKDAAEALGTYRYLGRSRTFLVAIDVILQREPEIIFIGLDFIEEQFEVVHYLRSKLHRTGIIGYSRSKEKAYLAMKNGFFDFLLKPLHTKEIHDSLIKYQNRYQLHKNKICLKSYKDYRFVTTEDILFLKASNNTTEFYLRGTQIVHAFKTLKTYETKLPEKFLRVHRSYIVHSHYVTRIHYGKHFMELEGYYQPIPFASNYQDNVHHIQQQLMAASF